GTVHGAVSLTESRGNNELLFCKRQAGDKSKVKKRAQTKVPHNAQIETGVELGLNTHKSIGFRKGRGILNLICSKVESKSDPEIIGLIIVFGHIDDSRLGLRASKGE